jgi:hypothetical protein
MSHSGTSPQEIFKGALIGGAINAVINGVINWNSVKDKTEVMLTDNVISSTEHTVFAGAVPTAVSLAFILTSIAYFTWKGNKPPYFPTVFFMAVKHAFFTFGVVVSVAIMIQRWFGSVMVSPMESAVITALVAGTISFFMNYLTHRELSVK